MGKNIKPGIILSFTSQKGGVGKSTLSMIFADYLHFNGKNLGLNFTVVDCDDLQNSIYRKRERELIATTSNGDKELYEIKSIPSKELGNQIEDLQKEYDIIIVDLPGNMKQEGVMSIYYLIDIVIVPVQSSELDIDSSNIFFDLYHDIIDTRAKQGYHTTIYGLFNRINKNLLEFKEIYENKNSLKFPFMDTYITDSKVKFQRNMSTVKLKADLNVNKMCEELLNIIVNHLKQNA